MVSFLLEDFSINSSIIKLNLSEAIMKELIMLVGNIGCGKSFLAKKLAKKGAMIVNSDSLLRAVHGGEYLYYSEMKDFYHNIEETILVDALRRSKTVVVDRTNISIEERKRFIFLADKYEATSIAYDFGPGQEEHLIRRLREPQGLPERVWRNVFNVINSKYEKPTIEEGFAEIRIPPEYFRCFAFDFDATIVMPSDFPNIGNANENIVNRIDKLSGDISNVIIIWTCRSGDYENQMRDWLDKNKVYYDFINDNPLYTTGSRKIFAHAYIDDRNHCLEGDIHCVCSTDKVNFSESL